MNCRKKIAIIGKAFRLPTEIDNDKDLWAALINGKDLITEVDDSIFDKKRFFHKDKNRAGKSYCFQAGVLKETETFDASFFNISQKEAMQMDPQQRILLELTWNAIEDSGYNPINLKGKNCGVYLGIYDMDFSMNGVSDLSALESYSPMGGAMSIAANRISYFFDFHGPSMAIDTACSSVMVALHQACTAIKNGEIEMAVVGGINLFQHPQPFIGLSKANMLSPEGRCKSFSNSNNGYVRSEGAVVIIIKPLENAEKDKDVIHGLILNTATNCDGRTNGLPLPSADSQAELMIKAYNEISLTPDKITYFEAHGTGTKVGDPVEIASISNAIALKRKEKLPVGSIKSNLGHLEPASGFAGILKGLLCIKHKIIPPTIHCDTLNPDIDFENSNINIIREPYKIDENEEIIIGVNSFGFGGSNAHALISEYRNEKQSSDSEKCSAKKHETAPFVISANSEKSLKQLALKYSDYFKNNDYSLYDICYNSMFNKPSLKYFTAALNIENKQKIISELEKFGNSEHSEVNSSQYLFFGSKNRVSDKNCMVFSGNGCQWFGMGKTLIEDSEEIKSYLVEADKIYKELSGSSIIDKLLLSTDEKLFSDTEIAQPALLIIQTAIVRYLASKGLRFDAVIGHSVGEIAAAWACGALSLKDAITLIYYKSKVQSKTRYRGKMAVIGEDEIKVSEILQELALTASVEIAGINSPSLITVSGKTDSLEKLSKYAVDKNIYFQMLDLDYPFHSKFMSDIEQEFKSSLSGRIQPSNNSEIQFVSTVYSEVVNGEKLDADYWWENIIKPVRFKESIDLLLNQNYTNFIEIGTHSILLRSVNQCAEALHKQINSIPTLKKFSDEIYDLNTGLINAWQKCSNWDQSIWFPEKTDKLILPLYQWDRKRYRASTTSENNGPGIVKYVHPLLGWRIFQDENIWENHLDATNCNELRDHVVGGALIFPAAGFLEMAIAANKQINDNELGYIDNLQMITPLILEEDITHQVQLKIDEKGYFIIKSRPRLSGNEWTVHASGRIVRDVYFRTLNDEHIKDFKPEEKLYTLSSKEHYDIAASVGLNYKEAFQSVKSIDFFSNSCSVELEDKVKNDEYIFGVSILDGGIHSLISLNSINNKYKEEASAFLPAGFESVYFLNSHSKIKYAKISLLSVTKSSVKADIIFYDAENKPLIMLNGARFNSANLIAKTKLPHLYEYKPLLLYTYDENKINSFKAKLKNCFKNFVMSKNTISEEVNTVLEQLLISYLVLAVKKIFGKDSFDISSYTREKYERLYWAVKILEEDEYVFSTEKNKYTWNEDREFIYPENIFQLLMETYSDSLPVSLYIARIGKVIDEVLLGNLKNDNLISEKSGLYEEFITDSFFNKDAVTSVNETIKNIVVSLDDNEKLKILEIGSGIYSSYLNEISETFYTKVKYNLITFDKFFTGKNIKKRFNIDVHLINVDEKISDLNIDEKFDLVLCSDIFAFENIGENIKSIKRLLDNNGILLLNESTPSFLQHVFNGLKPYSYKNFSASSEVNNVLTAKVWQDYFEEAGFKTLIKADDAHCTSVGRFTAVFSKSDSSEKIIKPNGENLKAESVLFIGHSSDSRIGKFDSLLKKSFESVSIIEYDRNPENIVLNKNIVILVPEIIEIDNLELDIFLLTLLKQIQSSKHDFRLNITLITKGGSLVNEDNSFRLFRNPKHAALTGFMRVAFNELSTQADIQVLDLQTDSLNSEISSIIKSKSNSELIITENAVFSANVFTAELNYKEAQNLKGNEYIRIELDSKGSFNNLHWRKAEKGLLAPDEIAFKPVFVGLNFRDIMYSLGLIPEEVVENSTVGSGLGLDFSGIVEAVGSNVTGFAPGDKIMGGGPGCFATFSSSDKNCVFKLTENWSFEHGATVYTVFLTAYASLTNLARLSKGEKVLIHGAAGGVGIAAIQIAKHIGAEVYATVGSDEKRDFLELLGVKHIYNSRTLDFAEQILKDTNGEGIDVILNSLANEAIDANLKILKPFGRFVEMGKRDIYKNYRMGLKPFRNNISYFCINIEQLMIWRIELTEKMFHEMNELFIAEILKPLPYKVFPASKIKDAFKYLQSSKHIGKIVIDMNDDKIFKEVEVIPETVLSGTYLVTGGTNGFGLDISKWLVEKGVKKLILISRSGKLSDEQIRYFEEKEIDVLIRSADVNSYESMEKIFDEIRGENIDLKGIIHAAAVYDDELIEKISNESYEKVVLTKIRGAEYLDKLSRNFNIENFILISSVTALFGNIGQVNYVAANSYLESLAAKRRQQGLNANYIALGGILDTGLLTRNAKLKKVLMNQMGEGLITVEQALMSLDKLISKYNIAGFAVMDINVQQMEKNMALFKTSRFDSLRFLEKKIHGGDNADYKKYLKNLTPEEARNEVIMLVREEIASVLELPIEEISQKTSVKEFGFDSLMGFDLAVAIEKRIGTNVPPLSLQQAPNAENIADILLPRLIGEIEEEVSIEDELYAKHGEDK